MGEPVEVVEGSSDAEISRLFPKCRPRLALTPTFNAQTTTPPPPPLRSATSDVNRNCVSDANDNYEAPLAPLEEPLMTSLRGDDNDHNSSGDSSSSSSSSRMSVDSAGGATPASTPVSRSSSSYSGGGSNLFPPTCPSGDRTPLGGDNIPPENENDDLSVVSAYLDERFSNTTALLDSSYEDPPHGGGQGTLGSPTSHKLPSSLGPQGGESPVVGPLLLRRGEQHFRLRDSRIESAGGKEVFSQSRSRPSRKRHEDARRPHHAHPHHAPHHYNHHAHLHQHHQLHHAMPHTPKQTPQVPQSQPQLPQQQPHPPPYLPQLGSEYLRKAAAAAAESSSSRSHSSSSSGGGSSSEGGKEPPEEEGGSSTYVYETRLVGSSEVVFDDIGEWVERGLTVRGVQDATPVAPRRSSKRGSNGGEQQHFIATPPTPPSQSDRDSEYDDVEDEDEEEDEEEDGDSSLRVTRIGGVQIAEYEGSPRRYGQPQRPPRPGFPRRVSNCTAAQEERARSLLHSLETEKKGSHDGVPSHRAFEKTHHKKSKLRLGPHHHHHLHTQQHQQVHDALEVDIPTNPSSPFEKSSSSMRGKDPTPPSPPSPPPLPQTYAVKSVEDLPPRREEQSEESGDMSSPMKISISTLTSSYASSLPQISPAAVPSPTAPSLEQSPCITIDKTLPPSELYEDYGFEDSETRKVLEEFFLEARVKQPEFFDLEYTLKRQHGNSYVGQRLAAAECEEGAEQQQQCSDGTSPTKEEEAEEEDHQQHHINPEEETDDVESTSQRVSENLEGGEEKRNKIKECESAVPSVAQENSNGLLQESSEVGISRNFTLSPETTSCDSLDVESEFSGGEGEGSIPSSGKVVSTMPVLEDGLSSGEESEMEVANQDQRIFAVEDPQAALIRTHQLLLDQHHHHLYHSAGGLQLYEEGKEGELVEMADESERERAFQRARSLDNQLCRGELPPLSSSITMMNHHHHHVSLPGPPGGGASSYGHGGSPFQDSALPHATSSPHAKHPPNVKSPTAVSHSPLATHSPSTSTLTLMKKQISEIEREIALKKPEGGVPLRRSSGEGETGPPTNLDLHLLDPLNKKVGEPPPPPAPHPHRGGNNSLDNGSPQSSPPHTSSASTSPSRVIGHLHSPQFTPVSVPVVVPKLLSTLGSLTSPGQVSPHMVPGHPATLDLQHKPGNGVSPSRESVEAAIADIKQAIRRTKNLPLKTHPQEKQDRGPVWIPRNNRRELPYSKKHSSPSSAQTQENSPQLQHHDSSPSGGSNKSQDRSLHEEEDGDTDQETDRLLGQQRSDDGYLEEKNWSRMRPKPVVPMTMAPNHKEADSEGGGLNSNDSSPSTPSHHGSTNLTPSSPQDMISSNKFIGKKEKEYGKKKGRSKEVMVHEPAVLIEGVLFRARYLGSTQLVSEGQPTKTTRMMQAEEAVSRIKAPEGEVQPSTEVDLFISTEKIMVLNTDLKEIMMDHALRTISYIADIGDLVVLMARRRVLPTDEQNDNPSHRIPKMICHVFESDEAQFIAQSIGQAFQVAYLEFLKANGIEDHSFVKEMDYQEVLNSQEIFGDELQMFAKKELQKEVVVPKMKGEILGVVVVESGWGSMVPTVVIANLSPTGAAAKCGQLNIGDQIIAINGISLVGLPLSNCQNYIKNTKYNTAVKLTVVPCPPVVEVKIRRPDTKYQLGFSVQNGVICSLLRGGIAERGGVRVGHRIIDINSQSVVAVPHEKIVNLLATSVGEIRMKTMPTSIFRLLTGQETPQYI